MTLAAVALLLPEVEVPFPLEVLLSPPLDPVELMYSS
jgi:hypothetical protein